MLYFAQIETSTNKLQQVIGVSDKASFDANVAANPASFFIPLPTFVSPADSYFDAGSGTVKRKPEMPALISGSTIYGLPNPSFVVIVGSEGRHEVTDEVAELEFTAPGVYEVRCDSEGYISKTFKVTI